MISRASRDSKLYPYADPWEGQRGPFFERNWLPDMLSGLGGVTEGVYYDQLSKIGHAEYYFAR